MEEPEKTDLESKEAPKKHSHPHKSGEKLQDFLSDKKHLPLLIGVGVVLVCLMVSIDPYTRYGILSRFVSRSVEVDVTNNGKAVSDAQVVIGSSKTTTDAKGIATFTHLPVGNWQVEVNKKYYNLVLQNITVPVIGNVGPFKVSLPALGNPVSVYVINKITGKSLAKASISALGATAITDDLGVANLVLPVGSKSVAATLTAQGYDALTTSITNTSSASANTIGMVPSGTIYYLSNLTGTMNIMKANLDGSNASVLVPGTGNESQYNTTLLSTTDWKYLALQAVRSGTQAGIYLINPATGRLSDINTSSDNISILGWYDHNFIYEDSTPSSNRIVSFNADTLEDHNLASTDPSLGNNETLSNPALLNGNLVYADNYSPAWGAAPKVNEVNLDTGDFRVLKTAQGDELSINLQAPTNPDLLYFNVYSRIDNTSTFFSLTGEGSVTQVGSIPETPTGTYYLQSPAEDQTLWSLQRDGKNTIFTGDANGRGAKQIATLSDYTPFGWYTDNFVLLSKNKSELYIAPADMSSAPIKIADYFATNQVFSGYGGGYGGN